METPHEHDWRCQVRGLLRLSLFAVIGLVLVGAIVVAVDRFAFHTIGRTWGTVVTLHSFTTSGRHYRPKVVVDLGARGIVTAPNPLALPVVPGMRVELTVLEGELFGLRSYRVERVLQSEDAVPSSIPEASAAGTTKGWIAATACLALLSLVSLVHLWATRRAPFLRKLGWSAVVFVPLFGPILYYGLFSPPPVQQAHLRGYRGHSSGYD